MGTDFRDDLGLICGFRLQPPGAAVAVDLGDVDAVAPPAPPVWLHFNFNDTRARSWIDACRWLAPEGRETLLSGDRRVRLDATGNDITAVLADIYADDPDAFGVIHLYVDATCLITTRRHPTLAARRLRDDLAGGLALDTSMALFNRLLGHVVSVLGEAVAGYADLIDDAEEQVFAGDLHQPSLGQYRRTMARLRRQLTADRHALLLLPKPAPTWWSKPESKELNKISAMLATANEDLELAEERARLVSEEIDSRFAARTNRNLYFVSVAAAVLLPVTLISGIFGMNVGGLPWVENESGFAWAMGCMGAAIVIALMLMLWRRML